MNAAQVCFAVTNHGGDHAHLLYALAPDGTLLHARKVIGDAAKGMDGVQVPLKRIGRVCKGATGEVRTQLIPGSPLVAHTSEHNHNTYIYTGVPGGLDGHSRCTPVEDVELAFVAPLPATMVDAGTPSVEDAMIYTRRADGTFFARPNDTKTLAEDEPVTTPVSGIFSRQLLIAPGGRAALACLQPNPKKAPFWHVIALNPADQRKPGRIQRSNTALCADLDRRIFAEGNGFYPSRDCGVAVVRLAATGVLYLLGLMRSASRKAPVRVHPSVFGDEPVDCVAMHPEGTLLLLSRGATVEIYQVPNPHITRVRSTREPIETFDVAGPVRGLAFDESWPVGLPGQSLAIYYEDPTEGPTLRVIEIA